MFPKPIRKLAEEVLQAARGANLKLATAESCTGGLVAGALTEIPGSSDVVERGYVTYSNQAKCDLLGVTIELLMAHGAVSEAVARAMAEGAINHSGADIGSDRESPGPRGQPGAGQRPAATGRHQSDPPDPGPLRGTRGESTADSGSLG